MGKRGQKQWTDKQIWLLIIIGSLYIAIISHLYFIYQKSDGILMTGFNDGLSQMIPFKKFIYDQYTSGNFFYSDSFGLGGGFYSQLGYYYSTNIFFLLHVVIIYFFELLGWMDHPDISFWADAILPMSILKLTITLILTTYYFRQIKFGFLASFLGAIIYAVNVLYFRHTMYWDFFSDAFIWFILLLIGVEKIIQKKSGKLFVIAVACNMITNFYFSYVNFLLAFFYILLRLWVPFFKNELSVKKQLITYITLGITGALISSFAFIPSVVGYLHNYRPAYTDPIPMFSLTDNILFNSRVFFLPIFIVIIVCSWRFYKHAIFRFFAILSIIGVILHFVPFVGSMFNGFSAPQNRWEHIVGLAFGGITAFTLQHLKELKLRDIGYGVVLYLFLAWFILWWDDFSFTKPVHFIIPLQSLIMVLILIGIKKWTIGQSKPVFFVSIALFMIVVANTFQAARLMIPPKDKVVASEAIMDSEYYYSDEQRSLIELIEMEKETADSRLDWMVPSRNNTPIVQDFKGFSVYSSILNANLLLFYYDKLQIAMEEESVSWYDGMGDRVNLLSLFNGRFYMREKPSNTVPYGFQKMLASENYQVYENQWLLPPFRKTDELFSEDALQDKPVLVREQAMLQGAIIDRSSIKQDLPSPEKVHHYDTELVSATYDGERLEVEADGGGVQIEVNDPVQEGDFYLSFYIRGVNNHRTFLLKVNEFQTIRSASNFIYRTGFNALTIRIAASDQINIRLPKGTYELKELEIYYEDYQTLKNAYHKYTADEPLDMYWNNGYVEGNVTSENEGELIVTPIPYEQGWKLRVNGEVVPIEKVNYAFIGIPLERGSNHIEMSYRPPFFRISVFLTTIGILLFCFRAYRKHRKGLKRRS